MPGVKAKRFQPVAKWKHTMGETMEEDTIYQSISSLLVIDVICILCEFIVHDKHYAENHAAHVAGYWIKVISLSILGVFQAEAFILMIAFGKHFWEHWGHILDAMVIPISIIFETQISSAAAGLIVLLRFWRLIRVAHGIWESRQKKKAQEREEEKKKAKEEAKTKAITANEADGYNESHPLYSKYPPLFNHDPAIYDSDNEDFSHHEIEQFMEEWTTFEEEAGIMHESEICPEWRIELHEWLDEPWVHNLISILLVIDVLCVLLEFVVHDDHFYEDHNMHKAGFYISCCSISILGFFQFECFLNMNCTGRFLLEFYGHFLDALVVPVSIILEFLLQNGAASLLILLRFWRLVRIMHGVFVADEENDARKETLHAARMKSIQKEVERHSERISNRTSTLRSKQPLQNA